MTLRQSWAQMRDDDAAIGSRAKVVGQDAGDVFVRKTVKAIALHAGFGDVARQGISLRHPGLRAVKFGVEAGDLRQFRPQAGDGADGRQVVRLVQRGQRRVAIELGQDVGRYERGPRLLLAAMHHPVAGCQQGAACGKPLQPVKQLFKRFLPAEHRVG